MTDHTPAAQAALQDWNAAVSAANLAPTTGSIILNAVTVLEIAALLSKQRAPVADSTLPLEQMLHELVSKIDAGLDTGDLLQDARRASTVLDAIMTGGDLVACAHTFFKECGEDKWRDRYERSLDFRLGWNACLDAIEEARVKRAALASAPVAIPAGFALVPIAPTPEMLDAADERVGAWQHEESRAAYSAMIGAAPVASAPVAGYGKTRVPGDHLGGPAVAWDDGALSTANRPESRASIESKSGALAPVAGEAVTYLGDTVAERLESMADDQPPGSQAQSDLYAAATIWRKHIGHHAAPQASEAVRDGGAENSRINPESRASPSDTVALPPLGKPPGRGLYHTHKEIQDYARAAVLADRQLSAGDVGEPTPEILRRMDGTHQAWSYTGLGNSMDSLHRALYRDVVAHCKRVGGAERSARNDALEEAARLIETTRETCDEPKPQQFVFGLKPRYEPRKDPFNCYFPEGLLMSGLTWASEIRRLKTADATQSAKDRDQ